MNSMKRQKDMTLKNELPRLVGAQYATGEEQRYSFRRNKRLSQSGNNAQLWMCLMVKVESNAVKNNIASDQIRSDQSLSRVRLFATP